MLSRHALVATLVEKDRGRVAVVDDCVAHYFEALGPFASVGVALGVARRHSLNQTYTVAALYILLVGACMHPAHKVTARFDKKIV